MVLNKLGRGVLATIVLLCAATALAQVPSSQHVVLVIDENHSLDEVIVSMPWTVAQGYANGYSTNYESDNGGSLLDYLWLASGSCESSANCALPSGTNNFNCSGNDCYYPGGNTTDPITDNNIFRLLNNAGISWKVYAQSYSAAGGTPTTPDNNNGTSYYRRHNGATWYSDILNNVSGSASKIVDFSQLSTDVASGNLPRFTIIVPDGNNDAHDCPVGMSTCSEEQQLAAADAFLNSTLTPILATPDFQPGGTGVIFVTFDECGEGTDQGCGSSVYTALLGPLVAPHTVSAVLYKHENMLRTMLDSLGISSYPGAAATAEDMSDFFSSSTGDPEVTVSTPSGGASANSPVAIQATAYPSLGHKITGWWIYVDSVGAYNAGAVRSINPKVTMSSGTHTVVVRAWDSSGAFGSETFTVTVPATVTGGKPSVRVLTPTNQTIAGSPVNFQASASPSAGQTIKGWWIYVDGVAISPAGPVDSINVNVPMALGSHTVIVRAWDTSGAYGDRSLHLTVRNKPAIAVSDPTPRANVISPISVQASATPTSGNKITAWSVKLDGVEVYQGGAVGSINASFSASLGTHTVLVRAWDSSGAYGDQTFDVHVKNVAVNISSPAQGASVISPMTLAASAQAPSSITSWDVYVDSVSQFVQNKGSSISAPLTMSSGKHSVVVRAWDTAGNYGDATIDVTVP